MNVSLSVGRFLGAVLEVVSKWHATEALYEQVSSNQGRLEREVER